MKLLRSLSITAAFLVICCDLAANAGIPSSESFWKGQVNKVRLGMKQSLVEKYLPPRSEGNEDYSKDGASYTETYALDEHWSVAVRYDRSGYHEKNNPYKVQGFPNDKVIGLPHLIKQENRIDEKMFPPERPR